MPIAAPVYQPQVQVTLYKTIYRNTPDGRKLSADRFTGTNAADATIDLTAFLGDGSALRTSKGLRDPAGGFSIALLDKPFQRLNNFESLYGLIEPMDMIEIRMRHAPPTDAEKQLSSYSPTKPNIVMRGFVSEITRSESMGSDGRPQRIVTVSGQDYGKIWQMVQILFFPRLIVGESLLTAFKLSEVFGVGFQTTMTAATFAQQMISLVLNVYLNELLPMNATFPRAITPAISVANGSVSILGPQSQEGTIFDLMRTYLDVGVWNELYLEDREDGVYCVYRPNPYADAFSDQLIQSDATLPDVVDVDEKDVINLSVRRSDSDVANFYWVRAPRFDLATDLYRQLYAIQDATIRDSVLLDTYPNTATELYGTRVMYANTEMGSAGTGTMNSGQPQSAETVRLGEMAGWVGDRRAIMVAQNKDNVLLESGSIRFRGNEFVRPGTYLRLTRGGFQSMYYVIGVAHDFAPMVGFFTTAQFERGTGFIDRALSAGGSDSPYLAEMRNVNG